MSEGTEGGGWFHYYPVMDWPMSFFECYGERCDACQREWIRPNGESVPRPPMPRLYVSGVLLDRIRRTEREEKAVRRELRLLLNAAECSAST